MSWRIRNKENYLYVREFTAKRLSCSALPGKVLNWEFKEDADKVCNFLNSKYKRVKLVVEKNND